jgi:hypothetical protein
VTRPTAGQGARGRGTALNKKILCFVDEYGTAGVGDLYLGAVLVHARDAGRLDKCFSDLLEPTANEIHASTLDDGYLQSLLQRFWQLVPQDRLVLINQKCQARPGDGPVLYAQAVVETVKIALKRFQTDVLKQVTIGNIEVVTDVNHHNEHPAFDAEMARSQAQDGRFKGVKRVVRLDSAASRLLQLADVVAYSRKWIVAEDLNAQGLRDRFGIQIP